MGRSLRLIGHGLRTLTVWGALAPGERPSLIEVAGRRFRCLECSCVCLVVPRGVWPGHVYLGTAVVLALARWAFAMQPPSSVRAALSPLRRVGHSVVGWPSLRRWARRYGQGDGTLRQRAARFVQGLLATSPLSAQTHAIEPRIYAASLHHP